MASGLMTLAYIGEMAIVFNLAYLELNKGRYVNDAKRDIDALKMTIEQQPPSREDNEWIRGKTEILDRLRGMVSSTPAHRQATWFVSSDSESEAETRKHHDWWACHGYQLFDREKDKAVCQHLLTASAMLLVVITVLDKLLASEKLENLVCIAALLLIIALVVWFSHVLSNRIKPKVAKLVLGLGVVCLPAAAALPQTPIHVYWISAWWFFFGLLLACASAPFVFILIGRQVRTILLRSQRDAAAQFELLKGRPLEASKLREALGQSAR